MEGIRMAWFKHYRGMVTDDKFEEYFEAYEEKAFAMIYMFSLILERATKDGGYFRKTSDGVPHDEMSLRAVFRRPKEFYSNQFIVDTMEALVTSGILECNNGIYFVKNWEKYQSSDSSTARVQKHRLNKQVEEQVDQVMAMFNDITGKKYKHTTSSYRSKIRARLEDKYALDDFKSVITWKLQDWGNNPKMKKHLTPDTLFRPGHFDRYLNEVPKDLKEAIPAGDLIDVRDIYGTKKSISKAMFEAAEDGFYTKI
jgi:uncharacterized phage protein (TIGR02220 family)